jgi:SAM-dependent methyltransferase
VVAGRDGTADGTLADLRAKATHQWSRVDARVRREATHRAGLSFEQLTPHDAVRMAYRVLLRRDPDPGAWTQYTEALQARLMSCDELVDRIRCSTEFRTNVRVHASALHASLHASRCEFIIGLPHARRIVDLGGGHTTDERGALVALGYPYDFDELVIVDLPPDDRHPLYRSERFVVAETERGRVNYEYRSMVDLAFLEDDSVDLVYSGQSIEHVSEAEGDVVLRHVRRILRPGGHLALDTPNGRLTRLQQDDFIDPDHEVEYTLGELRDKLTGAGLEVVSERGLNWGGTAVDQGRFDPAACAANYGVFHEADACYLLALLARKPA